jgi:hypothetical protein
MYFAGLLLALSGFIAPAVSVSADAPSMPEPPMAVRDSMNGYKLSDFIAFAKKWRFISPTYRKDSGAMRFVYANDKAWKIMKAGRIDYPDGAAFAKAIYTTHSDEAFADSYRPAEIVSYQLMIKDKARFPETDGWGYVLTTGTGLVTGESDRAKSLACHACHSLVKDRGYVFIRPVAAGPLLADEAVKPVFGADQAIRPAPPWYKQLPFVEQDREKLPQRLQKAIPPKYKKIQLMTGNIQEHNFSGMMYEIRIALAAQAALTKQAVALVPSKGAWFSLAYPDPKDPACQDAHAKRNGVNIIVVSTGAVRAVPTIPLTDIEERYPLQTAKFCQEPPDAQ